MGLSDLTDFALRHGRQLQGLVAEVRGAAPGRLVIAGDPGLADEIRAAVSPGADTAAVTVLDGEALDRASTATPPGHDVLLEGAALLVVAVEGTAPAPDLEQLLRRADRHRVPIVGVWRVDAASAVQPLPYVLATDVVRQPPGARLPTDAVLARIGARAGARGFALAASVPALRPATCEALVTHYARLSGAVGAAAFVPGADLPAITLNQLRMVARIAAAHGIELDNRRLVELGSVVGMGFGLRAFARQALGLIPGPGWAIKGAVAYAGTAAIGRAATARCARSAAGPAWPGRPSPP